jgi:hypothetical protein
MIPLVLLRGPLLVAVLALASCRGKPSEPLVDVTPLGDAVRFLAVALVLGMIIRGIFGLWEKH